MVRETIKLGLVKAILLAGLFAGAQEAKYTVSDSSVRAATPNPRNSATVPSRLLPPSPTRRNCGQYAYCEPPEPAPRQKDIRKEIENSPRPEPVTGDSAN